jgi:PD-(D/E)XK endonuclease
MRRATSRLRTGRARTSRCAYEGGVFGGAGTCRERSAVLVVRSANYAGDVLTTDQKGSAAELAIAHAAADLGVGVFKPLTDGERYDLIFDLRPQLLRVQCKWAARLGDVLVIRCRRCRRTREGLLHRGYTADEIDAIAAHSGELGRSYFIPVEFLAGRTNLQLRLSPSRNNQRAGINWAEDFALEAKLSALLGAVAQLGERQSGTLEATGSSPVGSIARPAPRASLFGVETPAACSSSY